ncbi:MAG TPA: hypothetical protein DCP08_02590 [Chloroflexi bacterium]|nr:hypothetical protein [Chloroflexota bacterium]
MPGETNLQAPCDSKNKVPERERIGLPRRLSPANRLESLKGAASLQYQKMGLPLLLGLGL